MRLGSAGDFGERQINRGGIPCELRRNNRSGGPGFMLLDRRQFAAATNGHAAGL